MNVHIDKKTGALIGGTLVIGLLLGGALGAGHARERFGDKDWHMRGDYGMHGSMNGMMFGISGKQGDEFDKAFLAEMIQHHQGAITMAQQALASAKHQEIRDMAQKVIDAQSAEITQMQGWQSSWYGTTATPTPASK